MTKNIAKSKLFISAAAALISLDGVAAYVLSLNYAAELRHLLHHEEVVKEAQILLRLVHDAAGVMASYAATKNPEFSKYFDSLAEEIPEHVQKLHDQTDAEHRKETVFQGIERNEVRVVDLLRHVQLDVDNPDVTLWQMRSHQHRINLASATQELERELESFVEFDALGSPTEATLWTKQWSFALQLIGLALFNAISMLVISFVIVGRQHAVEIFAIDSKPTK